MKKSREETKPYLNQQNQTGEQCTEPLMCKVCKKPFNETDMKLAQSRPKEICIACFTSNA